MILTISTIKAATRWEDYNPSCSRHMMGIPTENHDKKSNNKVCFQTVMMRFKFHAFNSVGENRVHVWGICMLLYVGVAFKKLVAFTFPNHNSSVNVLSSQSSLATKWYICKTATKFSFSAYLKLMKPIQEPVLSELLVIHSKKSCKSYKPIFSVATSSITMCTYIQHSCTVKW
jgi:hypothetical protein